MTAELIPSTPGLVAVHENAQGTGETPVVGFLKEFDGTDYSYTAVVLNKAGKTVPVTKIQGYKRVAWSSTLSWAKSADFEDVRRKTPSLFESIFGSTWTDR